MGTEAELSKLGNQALKKRLEKLTGGPVTWWVRHDGNNWYEGEVMGGAGAEIFGVGIWDYGSKAEVVHTKLVSLIMGYCAPQKDVV